MRATSPRSGAADERNDAELLQHVARRDRDPRLAKQSQAAFYQRHVRYLYGLVLRQKNQLLSVAGLAAEDLVQETFHRAFERAHTFDADQITDSERLSRRARAWLGRIATHLLVDHLRKHQEVAASPYLERVSCEGIEEEGPPSPRLQRVSHCLEKLGERERDVLRVTALHYRAGDHQRLPNEVSRELADRWDTTNDNIRAIRTRAMKKMKVCIGEGDLAQEAQP